ncbi:MAG: ankyrin repeat domain-containing protein, partial [Methanobacteriota archaeon]
MLRLLGLDPALHAQVAASHILTTTHTLTPDSSTSAGRCFFKFHILCACVAWCTTPRCASCHARTFRAKISFAEAGGTLLPSISCALDMRAGCTYLHLCVSRSSPLCYNSSDNSCVGMDAASQYELDRALLAAAEAGDGPAVRALLEAGANKEMKGEDGATPLYTACWNGYEPCVRTLLEAGAAVEAVDTDGRTPLHA